MNDPYQNAIIQLEKVAKILKLEDWIVKKLSSVDKLIEINFPVKMDNGEIKIFKGFRAQHNNARGPYKGGIRFSPQVNENEVKALSMWMSWKCAVTNLPYGGGKGGVIVDPTTLSQNELEKLSRGYIRNIYKFIGENEDIPAPDMNTNSQIMAWMVDEYARLHGEYTPGVITAKPIELNGSKGRTEATGLGGYFVLEELMKLEKLNKEDITIAIQGFGNVGSFFGKFASENGFKIVAVSDSKGGIFNKNGIDASKLFDYQLQNGKIQDFPNTEKISNEQLLESDVTILVPAAIENVITEKNADKIKAKYIIELANGPVTPEADQILFNKQIISIPDVLANSGGVTVSYFEWVQNKEGYYWEVDEIYSKLERLMKTAFKEAMIARNKLKTDTRMAVYSLAVKKVADAVRLRGF